MDKIYINLNPNIEKFDTATFKKLSYYAVLGVISVLIIILFLGLFVTIRLSSLNSYKTKWKSWEERATSLNKIKAQLAELEAEKKEFQKIVIPYNQVASIFEDLFISLPHNIWLDTLSIKKDSLSLKGYVLKLDEDYLISLEKFINAMKKREYFSSKFKKINIKDSKKENFYGVEVLEFNIECVN
ncbi:MAG: hypothetical protein Q8O30_06720 [Candidatus Omnitrophota bacterium]|nr:hypothetical protein [Candidatus Omnitrophota bacterium]